jgi:hypothetical protein
MTAEQIEQILYERVKEAALPISGDVYYRDMRPLYEGDAQHKEDVVVAVSGGQGGDLIKGTCVVNVYVPDILTNSGQYYKDIKRCREISAMLDVLPKQIRTGSSVYFTRSELIITLAEPNLNEHFVSLKMDFKVVNEDY